MADTVFDTDETMSLRLPWPVICCLACQALLHGYHSMDEIVVRAVTEYLEKTEKTKGAKND
jgi:hypothetical protein